MKKRFGTDGVRGEANVVLTPTLAYEIGAALSLILADAMEHKEEKPKFIKQEKTDKPSWYVVYTYSGYENKVMANLDVYKRQGRSKEHHRIHEYNGPGRRRRVVRAGRDGSTGAVERLRFSGRRDTDHQGIGVKGVRSSTEDGRRKGISGLQVHL